MTDVPTLLPDNATPVMLALEQVMAEAPQVADGIDATVNIPGTRPPAFLDALLWEYGLRPLATWVPNKYLLLDEGRPWEIDRGTFAAVARGLGWLGVSATIAEAPTRRTWWNSFQLYLSALPPADDPNLARIEGITALSVMKHSDFRRGVYGYDAGAIETAYGRLASAMLGTESGVRLHSGGPLWSFGVPTEIDHALTEAEGTALDIWVDPPDGDSLSWLDLNEPWTDATFPWVSEAGAARATLMAQSFADRVVYFAIKAGDGSVIGYRRARVAARVSPDLAGGYRFGGVRYRRDEASPSLVYFEALTAFGDGAGQQAATVSLLIDPVRAAGVPPGRDWLAPGDLSGGVEIAATAAALDLRPTIRQQVKIRLRF